MTDGAADDAAATSGTAGANDANGRAGAGESDSILKAPESASAPAASASAASASAAAGPSSASAAASGSGIGGSEHDGRPTPLRLARVHLRLGSHALARAELESLAGRDALDEEALLDLAEVRWRTGDLTGAGEAANALVERGRGDALALVIAAEAVAALGRPSEARRLAGLAVEAADVPLDTLFAGMPRSAFWPGEPEGVAVPAGIQGSGAAAPVAAAESYAGGRAALASGDSLRAALGLGVALRLEPEYAQAVLDAIGEQPDDPALSLVVGDALRLLGRETDARAAFDRARGGPAPGQAAAATGGAAAGRGRSGDEDDPNAGADDGDEDDGP